MTRMILVCLAGVAVLILGAAVVENAGGGRCVGVFVVDRPGPVAGVNAGVVPLGVYRVWESGQVDQLALDQAAGGRVWVNVETLAGGSAAPADRKLPAKNSRFQTR